MCRYLYHSGINQSVENTEVAFVKRADERNKFFEKNKQTNKQTNNQYDV